MKKINTGHTCHQCKKPIYKKKGGISTGYGIDKENNKTCFDCCGENDRKELATLPIGGKTFLYLDTNQKTLTNWPGTLKIKIQGYRKGRHNIAGSRYDVWFRFAGAEFHGVQYGDFTQICHIKRIKS